MRAWLPSFVTFGYCMNISTTVDSVMEQEVYEEIQEDFRHGLHLYQFFNELPFNEKPSEKRHLHLRTRGSEQTQKPSTSLRHNPTNQQ